MKKSAQPFLLVVIAAGICLAQTSGFAYRERGGGRSYLEKGMPGFESPPLTAVKNQNGGRPAAMGTVPRNFRSLLDVMRTDDPLGFGGGLRTVPEFLTTSLRPALAPTSATAIWIGGTGNWSGNVGNNSMTLNNQGTIRGGTSQNLIIDPGSGGVFNSGTIESATGGPSLILQDGVFSNIGGTIRSNGTIEMSATASITDGTVVVPTTSALLLLNGGSITGGALNNFGRIINPSGTTGTLGGAVSNMAGGAILLSDASVLVLTGGAGNTYSNAGIISINTNGSANTDLVINGNVTLTGAGSVQLSNSVKSRIYGASATDVLTNQGNTISGSGNIGNNSMTLNNQGVITADSFSLVIDPGSGGVSNSGTIQAVFSGTLHLQDGVFTNTGTIQADLGGQIEMNATAGITGGTVNLGHSSVLTLNGGSISGGTLTLSSSASLLNPAGTTGTLGGTVNNASGR
jgi:hypothetical protein